MAKNAASRFKFKDNLTSIDYQKIMIEQNQTIIQLLSLQQKDLVHGAFNTTILGIYQDAIKGYFDEKAIDLSKLSERQRFKLEELKNKKARGIDITNLAEIYDLQDYISMDKD